MGSKMGSEWVSLRSFAGPRDETVEGTGTEMMGESPAGQIDTGNGGAIG